MCDFGRQMLDCKKCPYPMAYPGTAEFGQRVPESEYRNMGYSFNTWCKRLRQFGGRVPESGSWSVECPFSRVTNYNRTWRKRAEKRDLECKVPLSMV